MAASAIILVAGLSQLCHGVMAVPVAAPPPPPPPPLPPLPPQAQVPLAALEQRPMLDDTPPSAVPIINENAQQRKLHGRFLHITDFHPDEFYKLHTSTSADHACHSGKGPAGTYGAETSDCDAPISLVNATFDWITANIRDEIDFVIWTGDSARHDSDEEIPRSPAQVLGTNRLIADKFAETFSDARGLTIPVIPTFGNNDILPHNVLMPGPNKWLSYYADIWRKFIPEEQRHSFEFGGWFYVEVIPNNLAVFSLNTLYFFDRNAGVDDCVKPSEPGFKHLEWLRVQLQFLRERGMKAILIGHVPPARTESKMLWDETCWQKYTLWLQQYRDVVISGLYGHMNIDHFMISDTKEINIKPAEIEAEGSDSIHENLEDDLSIQSATDYLEDLREGWSKLPKPKLYGDSDVEFASQKDKHKHKDKDKEKKKKKKGKKDKNKKELGGDWAERYQLAFVSPSIVPNYFPTLRVFEYNITGLENSVTWADYTKKSPTVDTSGKDVVQSAEVGLELRNAPDLEAEKKKDKKKKQKKPKEDKKKKKGKKPKDPNLVVPKPPEKSSPPGPAYSPQPLTLTGYKQYYANLTYINNDIAEQSEGLMPDKWREGKHGDEKPKSKKPKPRKFEFEIEYTTFDDKLYNLPDLTVKNVVGLAYRMGQTAKSKTLELLLPGGDLIDDLEDMAEVEEVKGKGVDQVSGDESKSPDDEDDIDEEEDGNEDGDVEEEKNKKKGSKGDKKKKGKKGKKKKKKKKAKKMNKTWLDFLRHAFVNTFDDDELKSKFS